jgi:hypothetical protein
MYSPGVLFQTDSNEIVKLSGINANDTLYRNSADGGKFSVRIWNPGSVSVESLEYAMVLFVAALIAERC